MRFYFAGTNCASCAEPHMVAVMLDPLTIPTSTCRVCGEPLEPIEPPTPEFLAALTTITEKEN